MKKTQLNIHPAYVIDEVSPLIFGGFLEHMGRCVYEGVYDPKSAHADEDGFRTDVLDALREMQMTTVRYPGGNFASGYHWMDGIGPKEERPAHRELAWQSHEPNQMGTDEFIKLCRKMDWEPMLSVNLGTGTPEEARNWVEYCNAPAGTHYADMRAANGSPEPYNVKYWCLGNEMDGPWQLGHVPADQYAIRAQQAAKMMKDCDGSIQMVACGSSSPDMLTFLDWDRQVLEYVGTLARYVSLHRYVGNRQDNTQDYLAIGASIDAQIEAVDACCLHVKGKTRASRRTLLCFDEWNVWYKDMTMDGEGKFAPHLIEEVYNLEDALVVAQFMNSFIRHADAVKIANIAQIVNVIAPLLTHGDDLLKQSIFYAFKLFSERKTGKSLRLAVEGPTFISPRFGEVPCLDASAIIDESTGELTLFLVNRSAEEAIPLEVELNTLTIGSITSAEILHHEDPKAVNSYDNPNVILPATYEGALASGSKLTADLPPASLTRLVLAVS